MINLYLCVKYDTLIDNQIHVKLANDMYSIGYNLDQQVAPESHIIRCIYKLLKASYSLWCEFSLPPSGRRYNLPWWKTNMSNYNLKSNL